MALYSIDLPYVADATKYYAAVVDLPWSVWLDSGGMGRYDIITAKPYQTLIINKASELAEVSESIRSLLGEIIAPIENIPFAGGALGYWGYDLTQQEARLNIDSTSEEQIPVMAVGIYDWALIVDHQRKSACLASHARYPETSKLLQQIQSRLQNDHEFNSAAFFVKGKINSNFTKDGYGEAFAKIKEYLKAGDCYQINLAQRFSAAATGDAFAAYLKLRELSPAPFAVFLNFPNLQILCNSPERFLHVRNGEVETRPIKGTRPRSGDNEIDRKVIEELQNNPKDRAENLMIVDLLRNDLGKSCEPGSIHVPKLFDVESYSNVHHMVSTVKGKLLAGRDALHVFSDCFPGGSITGAPKVRAMQIIEQLEPDRRGIYCGSIGYIGFDGNMDSNIVIRTLVYSVNEVRCWAGGGIVADSEENSEYQETFDKAFAMLEILRMFGGEANTNNQR